MWSIYFNQTNNIIDLSLLSSEDGKKWKIVQNYINSSNLVNITAALNNSNGNLIVQVITDHLEIESRAPINETFYQFPLWSPYMNLSLTKNNTLTTVKVMNFNGTLAGITIKTFRIHLIKNQTFLTLVSPLKTHYVWGDHLNIRVKLQSNDIALEKALVTFRIKEYYKGINIKTIMMEDLTDDQGIAEISYTIPEIEGIDIEILYNGSVYLFPSNIETLGITIRSPLEQFFNDFFPLLIILGVLLIAFTSYITIKKVQLKKNRKIWNEKTQLFYDTLTIEYLLVIDKNSGTALIHQNFGSITFDENLISGFLQAISTFKYEIKRKESDDETRETMLLDYEDYKILLKDGDYIRVALILTGDPSDNLKVSQVKFIKAFEEKYKDYLINFKGDLTPFQDCGDLIKDIFKMSLMFPHVINQNPPSIKINNFQERIISIAKVLEADRGEFFISDLLKYLISAMPREPKERIIANVYDLREFKFLIPLEK